MSIVHRVVVGLIALTPLGAMAGAACVGKVASVYVELDTNVYFDIQPIHKGRARVHLCLAASLGLVALDVQAIKAWDDSGAPAEAGTL